MDLRYRVVLAHLKEVIAGALPEEHRSKEDLVKQTKAVEDMLRDVISKKMPEYRDKVFAVGGFVRDQLLGGSPDDLDLVVDHPEHKMKSAEIFAKKLSDVLGTTSSNNPQKLGTNPTAPEYGVWGLVLFGPGEGRTFKTPDGTDVTGYKLEITPPRKEGPYKKGTRIPEWVDYTPRADDARRRDLTINALYKNIVTGEIEDYVGGQKDLEDKKLQPPDHPEGIKKIYMEDPLRVFRMVRFDAKFPDFKIDPKSEKLVREFAKSPEGQAALKDAVKPERVQKELVKLLEAKDPKAVVKGLEMFQDWDLLKFVSPEFDKMLDIYHDKVHHYGENVWQHTLDVVKGTPPTLRARLAALFHDIGKIVTRTERVDKEGRPRAHFIDHDRYGKEMVRKALRDLKFPTDIVDDVSDMVHAHMSFRPHGKMHEEKQLRNVRLFIERFYDISDDALALLKADAKGNPADEQRVEELAKKVERLKKEDIEKGLLAQHKGGKGYRYTAPLTGKDIMDAFEHIKGGPVLGEVLRRLREDVLMGKLDDYDEQQRAEEAKKLVKQYAGNAKQIGVIEQTLKKQREKEEYARGKDEEKGLPQAAPAFTKVLK